MKKRLLLHSLRVLLYVLLCTTSSSVFSQVKHIEGNLIDTLENQGIKNAKIILINLNDSVILTHKNTDENGHFVLSDLNVDTFRLIIDHPKYETREFYFLGESDNQEFKLDRIILSPRGKKIEEITVLAYKDPVYYRGDTLIYVADSFKTRPNAVVEDLLKKLPGITVEKDGTLKSQGKNVARVYVDGDEFFGSDATLATKNLAASSIKTVEVYETTLADAQASDEKIQVIDLKLKDEAKKGYFGKASFATDFNRFYEGQLMGNHFSNKQKISAYFLTANTTKSALSWRDANQFGIEQGRAYEYNSETDSWEANNNFIATDDGFPQIFKTGVFYSDQVTKKLKIGANYTYSDLRKQTEETSRSQFFLPDTTYSNYSVNKGHMQARQHQANLSFLYNIDSTQSISFDPKFNLTTRTDKRVSTVDFNDTDNITNRQSSNTTTGENEAMNIKTRLGYTKNFKKDKRKLQVVNNFILDQSNSSSHLLYSDYFNQTGITKNGIDQQKSGDRSIVSNVFQTIYTEPINKKMKFEFSYDLFNTKNADERESFNWQNGSYSDLDLLTSGNFKTVKMQNKLGATFIYDFRKHLFTIGLAGRNVTVNNKNHITQQTIEQNVTDVLPKLTYIFRIGQNSSLRFNSQANSTLPSISHLQPVYDNSNPNSIRTGNENLLPNYSINTNLNYNTYNALNGSYIYIGAYNNYIFNDFVSSIEYDSLGRTISQFINQNSLGYTGTYLGGSIPIIKQVFSLDPNLNYTYNDRINLINNEKNKSKYHSLGTGLDISLYTDIVEFSFGFSYRLQDNKNTISSNLNLTNHIYGLNSDLKIFLPWKMELKSDFDYSNYNNMSEDFNIKMFIWNAEIEQKIGKNGSWTIALQAYDLLNQNTRITRSAYANVIVDNRTSIISRYFMLNLTYIFNSAFKKQKTVTDEE